MITYVRGNLFESPAQVLVNTVNTVGVMGKGIALQFKRFYPEMFREYQGLCERRQFTIGRLHLYKTPHKWVLNFPTKEDWRRPSTPSFVESGLQTFARVYSEFGINSIAFPPLGCGNGELDFGVDVQPLMEKYLNRLPIPVFIYLGYASGEVPEQRNEKAIRDWLRSDPAVLAFAEVWEDLKDLLAKRAQFKTANGSTFSVEYAETPPSLIITDTSGKRRLIVEDTMLDFWQQLREFGFTYRSVTPEHARPEISYLIPLFADLPYVQRVHVSDSPELLKRQASIALQVVPPSRRSTPSDGELLDLRV